MRDFFRHAPAKGETNGAPGRVAAHHQQPGRITRKLARREMPAASTSAPDYRGNQTCIRGGEAGPPYFLALAKRQGPSARVAPPLCQWQVPRVIEVWLSGVRSALDSPLRCGGLCSAFRKPPGPLDSQDAVAKTPAPLGCQPAKLYPAERSTAAATAGLLSVPPGAGHR